MTDSDQDPSPGREMTVVNPADLGAPKGFSHGMLTSPGAALLFVAGQIGVDRSNELISNTFVDQFGQALRNVVSVVVAAGGQASQIARLTFYVTDRTEYLQDLSAIGGAYREVMGKHFPAMALVEVSGLVDPGAKVEVEATAAIS